jgi:putative flippase GtrA
MEKSGYKRPAMFLLSAVLTGTIYMGLLYLCGNLLKVNPFLSVTTSYGAAMAFYFVTNKLVVFRKGGSGSLRRELIGFLPLVAVNYGITLIIVAIIRRYTGEEYSGSVVAGIVTTALAYLVFDNLLFIKKG